MSEPKMKAMMEKGCLFKDSSTPNKILVHITCDLGSLKAVRFLCKQNGFSTQHTTNNRHDLANIEAGMPALGDGRLDVYGKGSPNLGALANDLETYFSIKNIVFIN
jgi:hypothetical protein